MKIFDWVHRKFHQNFTQAPTKQHDVGNIDRSSHASLVDLLVYDQFSRVKTSGEDGSILKVRLQDNVKDGEEQPCKQGTVEHYFYNLEECGERSVQAVLVRDIQHGVLAIGTFGMSNLQPSLQNIVVPESRDKQVSPVVDYVPVDVEKFRKELEKVLYNRSSDEDTCPKTNIECGKQEKDQKSEKERSLADKHDRKTKSKKKVFPLRDFLEIPQAPSEGPVANKKKKTKKKLSSFSNLFNGQKNINRCEKSIHDSQSPKELSPETVDQKRSAASVLKRLMLKSRRAVPSDSGESTAYRTGLEKFLQAFRKKGSTSVQSANNCSPRKLSNKDSKILGEANNLHEGSGSYTVCPPPKQDTNSNAGNVTTYNHNQLDLEDDFETFKFEEWPNEFTPAPLCWLSMEDSSVLDEENGYWIKTDEEYVVLEL